MTQTIGINTPITLQRVVPETNTRRQYTVWVGRDLFGAPVVACRWGRIGRAGQMRTHACPDMDAAHALAADVLARRRQRGYDSGDETARPPSKVRARRPSVGKTRRRVATAKGQAAAAQLSLFNADILRAAWLNRWPRRTPFNAQATVAQAPQTGPDYRLAPSIPPVLALESMAASLMRLLGKPATAHERERWIEALITDPRMQGHLRRGRDVGRRL